MSELRGNIVGGFTIWCGVCSHWDQVSGRRSDLVAQWKKAGWRQTHARGWVCKTCSQRVLLSDRQLDVLRSLDDVWRRPMDLGACNGSHHSKSLGRLCEAGFAERRPRNTLMNFLDGATDGANRACSWEYRITDAGKQFKENEGT